MPAGEQIQLAAELMLQRGGAVFVRVGRLRAELDRRFDGERPGGQRQCQLCPDTLRCAGQQGKLPAQLAAIPAAEQQPRLRTAQKAAAVFEPALPFRQAAAIIHHRQLPEAFAAAQHQPHFAARTAGPQGIRKQMQAQQFCIIAVRHDPAGCPAAIVQRQFHPKLRLHHIGLCGDLKNGRTVHSLIKTMARCENIRFVLISPEELRVPDYIITDVLEANHIPYKETRSLEESMPELDILYMTRVQKERFFNEEDYVRLKNSYILTKEKMALAKPDMAVLHPLPRVNEITLEVDDDPRAAYFEQVQNAVYIRMALIMTLLGLKDPKAEKEGN